jgi:hypothetical protein
MGTSFIVPPNPGGGTDSVDTNLQLTAGELVSVTPSQYLGQSPDGMDRSGDMGGVASMFSQGLMGLPGLPGAQGAQGPQGQAIPYGLLGLAAESTAGTVPTPPKMYDPGPMVMGSRSTTPTAAMGSAPPQQGSPTPPASVSTPPGKPPNIVHVNVFGATNPQQFVQSRLAISRSMRY